MLPTQPNEKKIPNENREIKSVYINEFYVGIDYLR